MTARSRSHPRSSTPHVSRSLRLLLQRVRRAASTSRTELHRISTHHVPPLSAHNVPPSPSHENVRTAYSPAPQHFNMQPALPQNLAHAHRVERHSTTDNPHSSTRHNRYKSPPSAAHARSRAPALTARSPALRHSSTRPAKRRIPSPAHHAH